MNISSSNLLATVSFSSTTNNSSNSSVTVTNGYHHGFYIGPGGGLIALHGWGLWIGWSLLGFLQFASGRYLRGYAWCYMWLHIINGSIIGIITLIFTILGF